MTEELTPESRNENFLARAAGMEGETLEPESRKEAFLAKAAGESVETPEPESREEWFLNKIAEGGGGGGGGGGNDWGTIKYLDDDSVEHTATIQNAYEFSTLGSLNSSAQMVASIDGVTIPYQKITEAHLGKSATFLPDYFLGCSNASKGILTIVDGLENVRTISHGVFVYQPLLNCDIVLPKIESIGQGFLSECEAFNGNIVLGDNLKYIGGYFLRSTDAFNKELTITAEIIGDSFMNRSSGETTVFNSPITFTKTNLSIGNGFLSNNTTFNNTITFADNSSITIGNGFLSNNTAFNKKVSFGNGSSVTIGDIFLSSCTSFNSELDLTGVTRIGNQFMSNCLSFTQDLTIPSSVTKIGIDTSSSVFMYNCNNFTGILTCGTENYPGGNGGVTNVLSTTSSTAPMYTSGVRLSGTYAQTWKDAFPDRTLSPRRKLIVV